MFSDIFGAFGDTWPHQDPYGVNVIYSDGHGTFAHVGRREYERAIFYNGNGGYGYANDLGPVISSTAFVIRSCVIFGKRWTVGISANCRLGGRDSHSTGGATAGTAKGLGDEESRADQICST